ncbi:MAG: hypothetical protein ACRDYU_03730 [Actinomycetes bacterium]
MVKAKCPLCGRPVHGTSICSGCQQVLARELGDVAALIEALPCPACGDPQARYQTHTIEARRLVGGREVVDLVLAPEHTGRRTGQGALGLGAALTEARLGQTRMGTGNGRRSTDYTPRIGLDARTVYRDLRDTLATWIRDIAETHGHQLPTRGTPTALSAWLLTHMGDVRVHPAADEIATDIARVVARARRAVDRPPQRWYAGQCSATTDDGPCPTDLYADPEKSHIRCPTCGTEHEVKQRRQFLLDAAYDQLLTAHEMARAVSALGDVALTPERMRQWASRGRILPHGVNHEGRPTYLVSDAVDLLAQDATRTRRDVSRPSRRASVVTLITTAELSPQPAGATP